MTENFKPNPENQKKIGGPLEGKPDKGLLNDDKVQQEQDTRFEQRGGISDAAKFERVNDIFKYLEEKTESSGDISWEYIEDKIYSYLTRRKSPQI